MSESVFDSSDWIKLKTLQFFSIVESFKISLFLDEQVTLVLDKQISGPFSLIFTMGQLNGSGIHNLIYFDDLPLSQQQSKINEKTKSIIFLCRPRLELIQKISQFVQLKQQQQQPIKYYLIAVPNIDASSNYLLESEGLIDCLKIEPYDLGFIQYEADLFSMEISDFYSRCFVENDNLQLNQISKSFIKLQQMYGPFKTIIGKGSKSKIISEYIENFQTLVPPPPPTSDDNGNDQHLSGISKLKTLILIDRTVDLIPILCTQQTYQGLIDDVISISNSQFITIEKDELPIEEKVLNQTTQQYETIIVNAGKKEKVKINLSPITDLFFQQIKDFSFSSIPTMLYLNAQSVKDGFNDLKKSNTSLLSLPEIKKLLSKVPDVQKKQKAIETHTLIVEELLKLVNSDDFQQRVSTEFELLYSTLNGSSSTSNSVVALIEFIEYLIIRKKPMYQVLRLLSICCLTVGISLKAYQEIQKSFIHVYGIENIPVLIRMEKAGLIGGVLKDLKYKLPQQIFKNFNLLELDNDHPSTGSSESNNIGLTEYDQVYQGYVPLITKIIEEGQKNKQTGWYNSKAIESKLSCIDHPYFIKEIESSKSINYNHNSFTMIMFVGGCTYAEISSLRTLKKKYGRGSGYDFIFGTTNIINGNNFLKNL